MCYEQYKQRYETPKAWKDKKQDKLSQCKKGSQLVPFCNMTKGFQSRDYFSNTQHTQGGNKPVNLGFKKVEDSPRELLKCWECGEPHLWRNFPHLSLSARNSVHNIQEALKVGDIGRSLHKINATFDGRKEDDQSTIVEIEGKIYNNNFSILIDPRSSLSYISPTLVESSKLKKVKDAKSWLVQLATKIKRKVT
jgi:hypothetical protein